MRFQDNTSLAEFLTAARRSPRLRDRLLAAIDSDPLLQGAALLHTANDKRESEAMTPKVQEFVEAMESGDLDRQDKALKGMDARLFRELDSRGFDDEWIGAKMGIGEH